jgi:hypothetical protein
MGQIGCPETLVTTDQSTLPNIAEERRCLVFIAYAEGASLFITVNYCLCVICNILYQSVFLSGLSRSVLFYYDSESASVIYFLEMKGH